MPASVRFVVVAAAFVAAFLERWWFSSAWHEAGALTSAFYYGDAQRLVEYAIAIARHQPFDNGIPFHPPGWPIVLAAFLKLFGAGAPGPFVVPVAAIKALLAALSAGSVAVATLIAYDIAGLPAMLAVAILGSFHFGHIVEGTVADTEALYSFSVAVAVFATLRAVDRSGRRALAWTAVAGAVGGYAMIVRAEFIACAVVLGACIVLAHTARWSAAAPRRTHDGRPTPGRPEPARDTTPGRGPTPGRPLPYAVTFTALFVIVLVPTTVWHWRTLSAFNASHVGRVAGPLPQFAPVTSYGPFNFAMANHEYSDGGPNRDHPMLDRCNEETEGRLDVGQLDLACPAVYDLYVHGYRIGAAWMLSHPADAAALAVHKLAMASGFLAQGYLADDFGPGVSGTRRRVDLVDPESRVLLPIHLALLTAGFWVLRRRPLVSAIVAAPLIAFVASTVLFYGYVRLGTSYLPVIWVLQGAAVGALLRDARAAAAKRTAVAGLVLVVLLAIDGLRLDVPRRATLDGPRTDEGVLLQDETVIVAAQ